jgi:hypothetical protein
MNAGRDGDAVPSLVELVVRPNGNDWEFFCPHCDRTERYLTEKEALDAARDHRSTLGLNQKASIRQVSREGRVSYLPD